MYFRKAGMESKLCVYDVCVCVCVLMLAGVEPGTVVVTNKSFNAFLKEAHEVVSVVSHDT